MGDQKVQAHISFVCFLRVILFFIYVSVGAEQMAQWLRAITALPETQV